MFGPIIDTEKGQFVAKTPFTCRFQINREFDSQSSHTRSYCKFGAAFLVCSPIANFFRNRIVYLKVLDLAICSMSSQFNCGAVIKFNEDDIVSSAKNKPFKSLYLPRNAVFVFCSEFNARSGRQAGLFLSIYLKSNRFMSKRNRQELIPLLRLYRTAERKQDQNPQNQMSHGARQYPAHAP